MVYFGNLHPGTVMIDAKPIPDSDKVVAIFSPGHGQREHDGVITVVDPRKGPDEQSFAQPLTRSQRLSRSLGLFREPVHGRAAEADRAVGRRRPQRRRSISVSAEEDAAGLECHEPRPIIRRQREPMIPDRTDPQSRNGHALADGRLQGPQHERRASPAKSRSCWCWRRCPSRSTSPAAWSRSTYGGSFTLERVLGTVPVEADGSASLEVPALRSVFFVALDENDMAVKRMQSFTAVEPGETTGCIGCHEQRTETVLPRGNAAALSRRPSRIEPIADCPDVFDFPRDVQPILDKLCADCHGYEKTARGGPYAGKVILTGDHGPMYLPRLFHDDRPPPVLRQPQPGQEQLSAPNARFVGQPHPQDARRFALRRAGR